MLRLYFSLSGVMFTFLSCVKCTCPCFQKFWILIYNFAKVKEVQAYLYTVRTPLHGNFGSKYQPLAAGSKTFSSAKFWQRFEKTKTKTKNRLDKSLRVKIYSYHFVLLALRACERVRMCCACVCLRLLGMGWAGDERGEFNY